MSFEDIIPCQYEIFNQLDLVSLISVGLASKVSQSECRAIIKKKHPCLEVIITVDNKKYRYADGCCEPFSLYRNNKPISKENRFLIIREKKMCLQFLRVFGDCVFTFQFVGNVPEYILKYVRKYSKAHTMFFDDTLILRDFRRKFSSVVVLHFMTNKSSVKVLRLFPNVVRISFDSLTDVFPSSAVRLRRLRSLTLLGNQLFYSIYDKKVCQSFKEKMQSLNPRCRFWF